MHHIESQHQIKNTIDDAMKNAEYVQKISDTVNAKMKSLGYSDQKVRTFLLQKQLKLNKQNDRMDVTLNGRHLFFVVVNEVKAGSYKTYTVEVVD